ncbi:MAG: ABC transporter substrate-binding protein [Patescibacteria group bacterium]|jgi:NitT/TauT family transport system substrate-binding protein
MKKILGVAIIFIVFALLLIKTPKKQVEKKLQKVIMVMPFITSPQWTTYYTTLNKGYYKDEGLDVEIQYSSKGNVGSIEQLIGGKADLIHTGEESVIMARSKGLDVVSVYPLEPTNVFYIVSEKSKNITKPEDLVRKKVGVIGVGSGTYDNLLVILNSSKIDKNQVEIIQAGATQVQAFIERKFDAAPIHLNSLPAVKEKIPELNVIKASDYSGIGRGHIVTSGKLIKSNPELIEKFLRATKKGLEYAVNHPEEAIDIYNIVNPDAKSQKKLSLNIWNELIKAHNYRDNLPGIDKLQNWQKSQDVLFDSGLITKKTDVAAMFTNKFIPK